jgi:hypothetical protein
VDAILKANVEKIDTQGIGVIVMATTGIVYTNQTGGYACHQPAAEGYFVPLCELYHDAVHTAETLQDELDGYFFSERGPYRGHCYGDGINDKDCDFLDKLFQTYGIDARVDRLCKANAEEAWIPVHYKGKEAFFVWVNSD